MLNEISSWLVLFMSTCSKQRENKDKYRQGVPTSGKFTLYKLFKDMYST